MQTARGASHGAGACLGRLVVGGCDGAQGRAGEMKVLLNHPLREVEVKGPRRVREVLKELNLLPESVLVVRGDDLVTEDEVLKDEDRIEIRPVISGG